MKDCRICSLCEIETSDKKNSHIFPKFLCKGIGKGSYKNRFYKIDVYKENLKYEYEQDSPKEDFIFCSNCEQLLADKIETPFKNKFYDMKENKETFVKFNIVSRNTFYRFYYTEYYQLIKLFSYSLLYRANISKIEGFKNFHLNSYYSENIRKSLLSLELSCDIPLLIFTSSEKSNQSKNLIGLIQLPDDSVFIICNDIIFVFDFFYKSKLHSNFNDAVMNEVNKVKVIAINGVDWGHFNNSIWKIKT